MGANQAWRLNHNTIVNEETGKCLEAAPDQKIVLKVCDGGDSQVWYREGKQLTTHEFWGGTCLEAPSVLQGQRLEHHRCTGELNQEWRLDARKELWFHTLSCAQLCAHQSLGL